MSATHAPTTPISTDGLHAALATSAPPVAAQRTLGLAGVRLARVAQDQAHP
jgi:hypothetical protein